MTWSGAVTELRQLLSDGDTDKLRYRKRVIGYINGTNRVFKTFEFRRITNLITASAPLGVYVDGTAATVVADHSDVGEFELTTAPTDGSVVEASYYIQWFLDTELNTFLIRASEWLLFGENYSNLPDGLKPAAKFYAAKLACEKLALRWAEALSETYMLEDAPRSQDKLPINQYAALAKQYMAQAENARDSYYTRSGQSLAPLFGSIAGTIPDVVPKK